MPPNAVTRVLHIISGLNQGGAEQMLLQLLRKVDPVKYPMEVVSLTSAGVVGERIERESGVVTKALHWERWRKRILALRDLRKSVESFQPDILQGWMYHGNIAGWLARKLAPGNPHLVWNIRCSLDALEKFNRTTRACIGLAGRLSSSVNRIVYNSAHSSAQHHQRGYAVDRSIVIPNGIDTCLFRPDPMRKEQLLKGLGLPPGTNLFGHIARYDPLKDHQTLLAAVREVVNRRDDAVFVLAGRNVDWSNRILTREIADLQIGKHVRLLGEVQEVAALMAGLDVSVCSSMAEGFPTVVAESMACEVPCVTTDVGDAAEIVGDAGAVVARRDPGALAKACLTLIDLDRDRRLSLAAKCRKRIKEKFSLDSVVQRYEEVYSQRDN